MTDVASSAPLLSCRDVSKRFGALAAVNNLSFDVFPGEVFFVDDISMSPTDAVHVWNPETLKAKLLPYEPNIFGGQRVVFQSPVD